MDSADRQSLSQTQTGWRGGYGAPSDDRTSAHGDQRLDASATPEPARARQIDAAAIAAVTDLYREILPPGGAILDLMSGWVSHLPPEIPYSRVVGVGLSACELAENPFLDEWRVQDLNRNPRLPFATARVRRRGDLRCDSASDAALRGHPRSRAGAEAGSTADRDLLEPLRADARHRLLVPSRRCRASLPDRSSFRRSRELDRHSLPRPDAARRRRSALCGDRPQPRYRRRRWVTIRSRRRPSR